MKIKHLFSFLLFSIPSFSSIFLPTVDTSLGKLEFFSFDFLIPAKGFNLYLLRSYNTDVEKGVFGKCWGSNLDVTLTYYPQEKEEITIIGPKKFIVPEENENYIITSKPNGYIKTKKALIKIKEEDGNTYVFEEEKEGVFVSTQGKLEKIEKIEEGWRKIKNDGTKEYFTKFIKSEEIPQEENYQEEVDKNHIFHIFSADGKKEVYKLTKLEDRYGNTIVFIYDSLNNIRKISDSSGRALEFTYNSRGLIISAKDPLGRIIEYSYNYLDCLIAVKNQQRIMNYTYDPATYYLKSITYPNGRKIMIKYDLEEMVTEVNDEGKITSYSYIKEPNNALTTIVTDPNRHKITYAYQRGYFEYKDKSLIIIDQEGNKRKIYRDKRKNITKIEDQKGIWSYTYDNKGNRISITDPSGNIWKYEYEPKFNRMQSFTDPLGRICTYKYDNKGNLLEIQQPKDVTTKIEYNDYGMPISIVSPDNCKTSYEYDEYGNVKKIIDPLENITKFSYDLVGRLILIEDANGNKTEFTYDIFDQIIQTKDALENIVTYEYDLSGNITRIIDSNNNSTQYFYDKQNRLMKVTSPEENTTEYFYDNNGNIISIKDPSGNITQYSYSPLNRLIKIKDSSSNITQYIYDCVGNLIKIIDPSGNIAYEFTYDNNSRLIKVIDKNGRVIQYTYDPVGNKTSMLSPEGKITKYIYNELNQLISLKNPLNEETVYTYYPDGLLKSKRYSNGFIINYFYDDANRLTNIHSPIENIVYSYDKIGNRISMANNNGIEQYEYDKLYRLIKVIYPNGSITTFSYDSVGNRTIMRNTNSTITYTYDQSGRLLKEMSQLEEISYRWDKNGNLVNKWDKFGTTTYIYDNKNNLIKIIYPDKSIDIFSYCPLGKRISKTDKFGITTFYLYDGFNLLTEYDSSNNIKTQYTFSLGIDNPISMYKDGNSYFYFSDALGSIRFIINNNQELVAYYIYDVFGNIQKQTETILNSFMFTGRDYEENSNLYYYRARYYDSKTGRFITKDPFTWRPDDPRVLSNSKLKDEIIMVGIMLGSSLSNPYVYCSNNPVNYVDPMGLEEQIFGISEYIWQNTIYYKILGRGWFELFKQRWREYVKRMCREK